jgi:hypothetical protein
VVDGEDEDEDESNESDSEDYEDEEDSGESEVEFREEEENDNNEPEEEEEEEDYEDGHINDYEIRDELRNHLENASSTGSFTHHDALIDAPNPFLWVQNFGTLALPITESEIAMIKAASG